MQSSRWWTRSSSLTRSTRAAKTPCDELRAQRNKKSKEIGGLMAKGQKEEAEKIKAEVRLWPTR